MDRQLIIAHRPQQKSGDSPEIPESIAHWKTCLREIFFLNDTAQMNGFEGDIYNGYAAYKFLLEVICGLHSPLIGETEILSQFKQFLNETPKKISPRIAESLLHDAKEIRTKHLQHLGHRSYGSLVRRYVEGFSELCLVGAGSLAQDLLPWICDLKVNVLSRSPQKVRPDILKHTNVSISSIDEKIYFTNEFPLVIAAPVENLWITNWMSRHEFPGPRFVIDLRGEGTLLKLPSAIHQIDLKTLYMNVDLDIKKNEVTFELAREAASKCALDFFAKTVLRPFGWDDLCA